MRQRRALLVALSGVRVKDQELLELGMTLPGFVERSEVIASLPSLGLLTLAAHTPSGWEVDYFEAPDAIEPVLELALVGAFDVVAISSLTARVLEAYRLADLLRAEGLTVVLGGLHASALPREALLHADAVVEGEGERAWPELLADVDAGRLRPLYSSFDAPFHLEESRVPRYDLLDFSRYNRIPLQTTRGCPRACSFCAASRTISAYKRKPIAQVERELDAIQARWPRPFVELADDNTFLDRAWSRELLRLFAGRRMKWFTETDASIGDDSELLELLAQSGCAQLLIGFESSQPEALNGVDPVGWKQRQLASARERIKRIQSHGISVNGCFVLGWDHDEPDVFERTLEFVEACGLAEVQITILTPFPGTELAAQLRREGRLLDDVYWDRCTLFDVTYRPARMSVDELTKGFRWLMGELYSDARTAARKATFRDCCRRRRRARPLPLEIA